MCLLLETSKAYCEGVPPAPPLHARGGGARQRRTRAHPFTPHRSPPPSSSHAPPARLFPPPAPHPSRCGPSSMSAAPSRRAPSVSSAWSAVAAHPMRRWAAGGSVAKQPRRATPARSASWPSSGAPPRSRPGCATGSRTCRGCGCSTAGRASPRTSGSPGLRRPGGPRPTAADHARRQPRPDGPAGPRALPVLDGRARPGPAPGGARTGVSSSAEQRNAPYRRRTRGQGARSGGLTSSCPGS